MSKNQAPATSNEASINVKTILVVEDDEAIGTFFVAAIEQETPHHALHVTDGLQALKVVNDINPDIFLLDYGLPHMNGIELYDQLHARKELKDVPALMISAYCPWNEARKRNITCVQKPVDLDVLLQAIEKLLT